MKKQIVAVVMATVLGLAPCVSASQEYETQNATQAVGIETGSEVEIDTEAQTESVQETEIQEEAELQPSEEATQEETAETETQNQEETKESETQTEEETKVVETETQASADQTESTEQATTEQTTAEETEVSKEQTNANVESQLPFQAVSPEGDSPYFGGNENQISLYAQGEQQVSQTRLIQSYLAKVGKGYSQSMRYDQNYYDCSSLILRCFQEFGLTNVPFSTYDWNNRLANMKVGDIITFHGSGNYLSYQLVAVNTNVFSNPSAFLVPGTIMVLIEQGHTGGHVAVSLGNFLRQDNGLNPSTNAVAIVNQTREYVASQLAARYGADYSLLMGRNSITGYINTWMDSDWLGTDMLAEDKYSGTYNPIWRVEAFNPSTGVCVTNVPRGTHGLTAKYVLVPVNTDSKLEEKLSIDDVKVTNVSLDGYQIEARLSATNGISNVLMPTWTEANGQDDLIWHTAKVSGNTATFYVKTSDHNNEGGTYITHIYLYGPDQKYCVKEVRVSILEKEIKDFTGFHKDATGDSYYYKDGKLALDYTGLVFDNEIWYYIKDGKHDTSYTGLTLYNGSWYYVEKGYVGWGYTGLTLFNGGWYYVQRGVLNWNYTGLTLYCGNWYYVQNGRLNWNYTGLALYYGNWYYVQKGILNWSYTGLTQYEGTWYYVQKGILTRNYTGLTLYYGNWYYVQKGLLDWGHTGLTLYEGTWYYVQNGILDWQYTGLTKYYGNWYYVEKGLLNWKYTGAVTHNGSQGYVENGILQQ